MQRCEFELGRGLRTWRSFVGLHVATALALVIYFWRDWVRIVRGLVSSIARREVRDVDQRLAWLLVLGTIPVGISGLLLEQCCPSRCQPRRSCFSTG